MERPDDDRPKLDEPLDEVGVRVLGCLIEKELTTPDSYPLTLNALTAACNQTSSRDPIMELDEATVSRSLDDLADRLLARGIRRGDARVKRFRQEIGERLHLHRPELAVLSVLMLRGAQTAGEIKTRTARAFEFVDPSHVEITLDSLEALETPLATKMPRRPGQKEVRYAHLLAGGPPTTDILEDGTRREAPRHLGPSDRMDELDRELDSLRAEVAALRAEFDALRRQLE